MNKFLVVSICFLFALLPFESDAQWIKTSGIYYGYISSLTTNGDTLFASTWEGVFRSTDNAENWLNVGPIDTSYLNMGASYSVDGNVFVGIMGKGIYMTSNNGESWNNIGPNGANTISMYVKDDLIIAGLWSGQFFLSTNMGTTWVLKNMPYPYDVICFARINDKIFAGTVNPSGPGGYLFMSTNNGNNWSVVSGGLPQSSSIYSITVCDSLLIISSSAGFYRSSDMGVTWQSIGIGLTFNSFTIAGSTLFASTGFDIYRSSDCGESWIIMSNGLPSFDYYTAIRCLTTDGENIFAGSFGKGIFRSTNFGEDWVTVNNGLQNVPITCVNTEGNQIILGTAGQGVFISNNLGYNWIHSDSLEDFINDIITNDSIIFASAYEKIYRSSNNGTSWEILNSGLPQTNINRIAISGSVIIAGTEGNGIYISTNSGNTWIPRNSGVTNLFIQSLVVNDSEIFAGTQNSGIFCTADNGLHWVLTNNGLPIGCAIFSLAVSEADIFASPASNGVFISRDNGNNWDPINNGLSPGASIKSLITYGPYCFAGLEGADLEGDGAYIYSSLDSLWSPINSGLPNNVTVTDIKINGSYLIIGTGHDGVWIRPLSELVTDIGRINESAPNHFELLQNFPNPFNSSTTISFVLPNNSFVSLKIFDVLGREIKTITTQEFSAGNHSFDFIAENLSSGVYLYKLEVLPLDNLLGALTQIRKMIFLK